MTTWVRARLGMQGVPSLRSARGQLGAHARAIVAELAVRNKLCSADAVARHFGRARSTICEQMASVRKSAKHSRLIVTPAHRVVAEVRMLQDSSRSGERTKSRHAVDTANWRNFEYVAFPKMVSAPVYSSVITMGTYTFGGVGPLGMEGKQDDGEAKRLVDPCIDHGAARRAHRDDCVRQHHGHRRHGDAGFAHEYVERFDPDAELAGGVEIAGSDQCGRAVGHQ